jgi:hypothetical protein
MAVEPTPAAFRWDKPERVRNRVAWSPSPLHRGYTEALRNAPWRRGLKAASLRFPIAEARERGRYAFLPPKRGKGSATLPHPRGKVKQTLRFPTGGQNSPPNGVAFLFCLDFVHLEQKHRDLPRCDVQQSCTSRPLGAFDLRAPLSGGEGRLIRPRRGAGHDARHFSSGQDALSKSPADPHGPAGFIGRRRDGGALSLGYFSLGKQRKVTRPPAGGRNARRVGSQVATRCRQRRQRPLTSERHIKRHVTLHTHLISRNTTLKEVRHFLHILQIHEIERILRAILLRQIKLDQALVGAIL